MNCLLCLKGPAQTIKGEVFQCENCGLLFKDPHFHLSIEDESNRYRNHQNSAADSGYIEFLKRLLNPLGAFLNKSFSALDFGCGPGPVLAQLLKEKGGDVSWYDPLFFPDSQLLNKKYDVVTSTEVVEHFKDPAKGWETLISLVKEGGILAVMTQFFDERTDYSGWWYKNDPTHVVFYREKTFDYICEKYGLKLLYKNTQSVVILKKNHHE